MVEYFLLSSLRVAVFRSVLQFHGNVYAIMVYRVLRMYSGRILQYITTQYHNIRFEEYAFREGYCTEFTFHHKLQYGRDNDYEERATCKFHIYTVCDFHSYRAVPASRVVLIFRSYAYGCRQFSG